MDEVAGGLAPEKRARLLHLLHDVPVADGRADEKDAPLLEGPLQSPDRKSTRLNSSHLGISYAVFCLKDTATTEIYTLSLHDALPISISSTTYRSPTAARMRRTPLSLRARSSPQLDMTVPTTASRLEEHTSELQSLRH